MDPTAERVTHNHIVGLTCQPHASQYFLITPKLLPDLAVHELQKVLLVNNGVYGERRFNFSKCMKRRRGRWAWTRVGSRASRGDAGRVGRGRAERRSQRVGGQWEGSKSESGDDEQPQ